MSGHQRSESASSATGFGNSANNGLNATPLAISIPRQRSFSSSFSMATSPKTFAGSSMVANNPFLPSNSVPSSTPFTSAFGPISPSNNSPGTIPILHRRFSSSFNQLGALSSPPASSVMEERSRRASMFGSTSGMPSAPIIQPKDIPAATANNGNSGNGGGGGGGGGGLFRKFSTSRSSSVLHDTNEVGPLASPPAQATTMTGNTGSATLNLIDQLKSSNDRKSRSSSPMRSMILNGQMLD